MTCCESRRVIAAWVLMGGSLAAMTVALTLASLLFGYDRAVRDMPVLWLTAGLVGAGLIFLALPWLLRKSEDLPGGQSRWLLWFVLAAGLAMRLVLFASEPILEDDYQRYLWDGAVTAHGLNPYAASPHLAKFAPPGSALGRVAAAAGPVLERVNHSELRTLYPPVAQGAFALAHLVAPFSLTAWRALILVFDTAAMALLLVLLRDLGRPPLYAALYWWNPVALNEIFNSAHMEAILVPLILAALVLALRGRLIAAGGAALMAAGAKFWPVLLLPLLWRPLLARPRRAAVALALAVGMGLLFAWPMLLAGLDHTSGLVAYARAWSTNSALFPVIERIAGALAVGGLAPGILARAFVGLVLAAVSLRLARTPFGGADDLTRRALLLTVAVFLLSPAQFPWYFLWVLPLLACRPSIALLLPTAALPLYYSAFYFIARDSYGTFTGIIVWCIWIPVWIGIAWDAGLFARALRSWRRARKIGQPT